MNDDKNETHMMTDGVVYMGDAVKATRTADGVKLAGYLVRFTNENEPDLTGDYFEKDTDFDIDEFPIKKSTYFNHGFDDHFKRQKLGKATLSMDDFGIWAETIVQERDEYEKFITELADQGKLGWSSGSVGHLIERKQLNEEIYKITYWPIAEASLTHTPAEFRNSVIPIKSLMKQQPEVSENSDTVQDVKSEPIVETQSIIQNIEKEEHTMEKEELQALIDATTKSAIEEYRKSEPAVKSESVTVVKDEADQPFKTAGEFFKAVKNAALYPSSQDVRLLPLKAATGMSEGTPADGGYLVPTNYAGGIVERMYQLGKVINRVSKDSISGNNMTYYAVDESSRASTRQGGILGYWLAEAGTKTSSKPAFRQVDLKLKKVAALAYATDELLSDVKALESWLNRTVPNELIFQSEDAIFNGNGVAKPLGIMQSPALVSPLRLDASKVQLADILTMWSRRWAGVDDYAWFINQDVTPQLYQIGSTYQNLYMPQGFAGNPFATLMGKPIIEVEYAQTMGTTGDIVLAAMSQYQAIDKGIESASSIHVAFTSDQTCFRFVYRIDGAPMWNSALTPFKGSNTQSPFVSLATASS